MALITIIVIKGWLDKRSEQHQREAFDFLLDGAKGFYFYGYPLGDCLQTGLAVDLYSRCIGDYERELAFLTMVALSMNAGYDQEDDVAYVYVNRAGSPRHNTAAVCFHDHRKWWIFELDGGITHRSMEPLTNEYKNFAWLMAESLASTNALSDIQIKALLMCQDPKTSKLPPATYYGDKNSDDAQKAVDQAMRVHYEYADIYDRLVGAS